MFSTGTRDLQTWPNPSDLSLSLFSSIGYQPGEGDVRLHREQGRPPSQRCFYLVSADLGSWLRRTYNLSTTSTDSTRGYRSVHQGVSRIQSNPEMGESYRRDGFTPFLSATSDPTVISMPIADISTSESAGLTDMNCRAAANELARLHELNFANKLTIRSWIFKPGYLFKHT